MKTKRSLQQVCVARETHGLLRVHDVAVGPEKHWQPSPVELDILVELVSLFLFRNDILRDVFSNFLLCFIISSLLDLTYQKIFIFYFLLSLFLLLVWD